MIFHVDANSFYASCEQIYRPDLRNKPVIVLSNNDGILIAVNKEAKQLGLKRGEPFYKVNIFCEKNDVAVFSSNYTLYADISRRLNQIYMEYAPSVEEYSIDESFLFFNDFNFSDSDFISIGFQLKERILKEIGVAVCVGIAPTKTLAKLYNKLAKDHNGVFMYNQTEIDSILKTLDCNFIWGIGSQNTKKLNRIGIKTALQLKKMPPNIAKKLLTIQGYATVQELNGFPCINQIIRTKHDSITSSKQFSQKVFDFQILQAAAVQYTQTAVEKLRLQKSDAGAITVYVSTCNYYSDDESSKYTNCAYVEFSYQTSYTPDIVKYAMIALKKIFRQGFGYRSVMIILSKLTSTGLQNELWQDGLDAEKKRKFMNHIDDLSKEYGRNVVSVARSIQKGEWGMSRTRLSKCYTTKISDIPVVK